MSLVHIPETITEVLEAIEYRKGVLAWWQDKLRRGRKPSRISQYAEQVKVTKLQIAELEDALSLYEKVEYDR
tara:strand:+ start:716 stop:931 length:216 start_codon:yes stop_codon:yes gene_type:complete